MSGIEMVSLVVVIIGTILSICCVALPFWTISDPEDIVRDNVYRYRGLWLKCQSFATGNWDCDDFNRFFLGLPVQLQAARALSISSIVFSFFSIIALLMGMKRFICGGDDKRSKRRIRIVGGVFAVLGGLLLIGAVSWYANDIRIQHQIETQQLLLDSTRSVGREIFGVSLFLGWVGGAFLIIGAVLIFCTSFDRQEYRDSFKPVYSYKTSNKKTNDVQEYV